MAQIFVGILPKVAQVHFSIHTGTSIKRRDGFNKMIEDALAGKIDLIVTKSVSRFARNTVDSLTTVRKLKDKGGGSLL